MIGAGTAHGVHPLDDGRSPFHFARRRLALLEPPHMHTSMVVVPAGEPGPEEGDARRRAAAADLLVPRRGPMAVTTTGDRRRRATVGTGRLPGPDVVRAVALIGVVVMNFHGYLILRGGERGDRRRRRVLRSVERTAGDALRRHVRARRRRRRHAVHPTGHDAARRRPARQRSAVDARAPRVWRSTAAGCSSTSSGRARSCPTTAPCSSSPRCCSRCAAGGSSPSAPAPRSPAPASPGGASNGGSTTARVTWLFSPGRLVTAGAAVRRRRQRHPPAAAVAGVLLRRHRARAGAADRLVATGGDRARPDACSGWRRRSPAP